MAFLATPHVTFRPTQAARQTIQPVCFTSGKPTETSTTEDDRRVWSSSQRFFYKGGREFRFFPSNQLAAKQDIEEESKFGGAGRIVMMPIGVPKVPYKMNGQSEEQWIDIYNRLYRERIIFLGQEIDDEISNQIIAVFLYLDSEDPNKDIFLYINSPGGVVTSGLAMFDTMCHINSGVVTVCVGLAASMGSFLLSGGTKGKRFALPHSRIMIHQPSGGARGQASDIEIETQQILAVRDRLINLYARQTGQTYEKLFRDMERDCFMSAKESKDYGLIDAVIITRS
eukprot:CAMPEP_0196652230 /NCGR_PEP_ID=MMETSP1086-20130531/1463_1 /TAXON_ID=77921 /ORGANISM="Cyanoptyche  gloeocystis , Strain SAG4.97" /LENGTH=283 /DNA_ID=CAMNT_0041982663 /DNA_START=56 /DNA_END=907 /DNA_ORIENTATION=+